MLLLRGKRREKVKLYNLSKILKLKVKLNKKKDYEVIF